MAIALFCVLFMTVLPDSCALADPTDVACFGSQASCPCTSALQDPLPTTPPDNYQVVFQTDVPGCIVLNVTKSWAPIGSDQFYNLLIDEFYTVSGGAAFFRVVPEFVVQFGISGSPDETTKWNSPIQDDPVVKSNVAGTVSYATAGPDTRTSQLFINLVDNSSLDDSGFAPFAAVTQGMDIVNAIMNPTPGDSNGVDQDLYTQQGDEYIEANYVGKINRILNVTILV
ncbi:hypothetical protein TL16_g06714 [Triparma laevis f. inornata]|uniref:Peptidyl-prolyl cis-trans isomerase n=1 Tax=Triparma laevis f. inornata TaxID=1714386 RepID=A0A9W7APB7_9STRA|nr:hypothetical protein TL16_g06714 [Triparma laevis f. inornata]